MNGLRTTIGLEVHVQLRTATKLFSPAPVEALGEPNTRVHEVDLGLPGVLPALNAQAVALSVRAALALEGEVQERSVFARKNYFYPDLPKGYQISQYEEPFCRGGRVPLGDGRHGALVRIHMEEDAGKLVHTDAGTLVDLNRAGVGLVEVVGAPDLHTAEDAHAFLVNLREILRYAGVSDCDMELGSLRCDANVSLAPEGGKTLGTKVEIKNLNSFKMVQRAIEYEERRQAAILSAGGRILQETRLWNEEKGETRTLRSKEEAADYRYFPEPDLPPLVLDPAFVATQRAAMGELPAPRRERFAREYGLPDYDVQALTQEAATGDWFEALVRACGDAKSASNWVMSEVLPAAKQRGSLAQLGITPTGLADLIAAVAAGTVNSTAARKVFARMLETGEDAKTVIAALGLERLADPTALEPLVRAAIEALPQAAADVKKGKQKARDALKGHVMRQSRGKADPAVVEDLLRRLLGS